MLELHNISVAGQPAARQYLAFALGASRYGLAIDQVVELRRDDPLTTLANAPPALKGVTNLRGNIVPILDLGLALGGAAAVEGAHSAVIILRSGGHLLGVVVDSVLDVVALRPDQIRPSPMLGERRLADYLSGVATHDERMLLLIELPQALVQTALGATLAESGSTA